MKRVVLVLMLLLLFQPSSGVQKIVIPDTLPERISTTKVNVVIDTTFFNNSSLSIKDITGSIENSVYSSGYVTYNGKYELSVTYYYLTDVQHSSFISYLSTIREDGMGYSLNSSSDPASFIEVNGSSYDANDTLFWLANNLWDGDTTAYTLFLMNLEELDKEVDHWFTIKPKDVDTEKYQDRFFSGTSGLTGGKQVSAWGGVGELPVHFLDISSSVWFGDFINEVWGDAYVDNTIGYSVNDFIDRSSDSFLSWLKRMVQPFFRNLFSNRVFTSVVVEDYNVPTLVLTDNITSLSTDKWIVGEDKIDNMLTQSFPYIDFNVSVNWRLLEDYKLILDAMDVYIKYDSVKDENYIELSDGFLYWLEDNFLDDAFGVIDDNKIPSLIFYMDDIDFRYGGVSIAGLGGMGWQLQIMSRDRFYDENDRVKGFSSVLLHEIGHSMGFYHPFEINDMWITDFTASVVGYYTSYPAFSLYERDGLARLYADYYLVQATYLSTMVNSTYDMIGGDAALLAAENAYFATDYNDAVIKAKDAVNRYQSDKVEITTEEVKSNIVTTTEVKIVGFVIPVVFVMILQVRKKYHKS